MNNQIQSQLFSVLGKNSLYSYFKYLNTRRKKDILYYKRLKELQKIVKNNAMDTFFQPILNLHTGETIGYEALNRPGVTNEFPNTELFYEFVGQSNQVFLFECFCRNISLKRYMHRVKGHLHKKDSLLFINIQCFT